MSDTPSKPSAPEPPNAQAPPDELRDLTIELRVFKGNVVAGIWAAGAVVSLALFVFAFLGWSTRQDITQRVEEAVAPSIRHVDSLVSSIDTVALAEIGRQVSAAERRYRSTLAELDQLAASSSAIEDRLIRSLPYNTALSSSAAPHIATYSVESEHDYFELLRPEPSATIPAGSPITAVVKLIENPETFAALLLQVAPEGSRTLSCHAFFKPVDGLNKLRCDPVANTGRYSVAVIAFLSSDLARDPVPGYRRVALVRVQ